MENMIRKAWKDLKKKKKIKKLAEANIKILKSGKIQFSKKQKIDLSLFANEAIEGAVVSRLDGIISKEDVVIDTEGLRCDTLTTMMSDIKIAELTSQVSQTAITEQGIKNSVKTVNPSTIVITINKKDAIDVFDFLEGGTLGDILRCSTLASIYSNENIKPAWVELNKDDNSNFTNILYIPKVMVFIDRETREIRKVPYYIDLLIVAVPSVKRMKIDDENNVEEVSIEDATARVIADIAEAAIKCGCKDLIFDPYAYKLFTKEPRTTANLWYLMTSSQRFIEQIHSINFALEREDAFITFNAAMKPLD